MSQSARILTIVKVTVRDGYILVNNKNPDWAGIDELQNVIQATGLNTWLHKIAISTIDRLLRGLLSTKPMPKDSFRW